MDFCNEGAFKNDFCGLHFVQPNRTWKTQFLKQSERSQRAVRSSFCWQYFCKGSVWCGKLGFVFFIYMCNYVYFYQNKYVYLLTCVQNCNVFAGMNNWKKRKNESFIYIIMRFHVYNESIYESVYLFISKYNCA